MLLLFKKDDAYVAKAARFDTSSYMRTKNAATGVTNSKLLTTSFWVNYYNIAGFHHAFDGGNVFRPRHQRRSSNGLHFVTSKQAGGGSEVFNVETGNDYDETDGWIHFLCAVDAANGVDLLYVNGVQDIGTSAAVQDLLMGFSGAFAINSQENNPGTGADDVDLSEIYLNTDEFIDISVEANRQKFIDSAGKPVSLGADGSAPTGNQPAFYLNGDHTDFNVNKGYSDDFIITGSLAPAESTPSD